MVITGNKIGASLHLINDKILYLKVAPAYEKLCDNHVFGISGGDYFTPSSVI